MLADQHKRLTLTSDMPIIASDVSAPATIYLIPYADTRIAIEGSDGWMLSKVSEVSVLRVVLPNQAGSD